MEMGGEGGKRGIGGWRWEDGEGRQALGISSPSLEPPRRPPKEPNPVVKPLRSCFEEAPRCISRPDTRHQLRRLAAKLPLRPHLSPPPPSRRRYSGSSDRIRRAASTRPGGERGGRWVPGA